MSPEHILGELMNEEDEDNQEHHSERNEILKKLVKKENKKSKNNVPFKIQPKKSFYVTTDGNPTKKKEVKNVNKARGHVKKYIEELSPVKAFAINELIEEEQDDDDMSTDEEEMIEKDESMEMI